ncbi:hypothetical protein TNCT_53661 [Trichonephila clavata]|uniref:Uncharacterized protein n=1 Tax=Trichonephila clavata TaxID=2740835 RepID=A0A8X6FEU9_TRICU|nr:hypothetical protein TNCT_53661 [Trichonephila clavata]
MDGTPNDSSASGKQSSMLPDPVPGARKMTKSGASRGGGEGVGQVRVGGMRTERFHWMVENHLSSERDLSEVFSSEDLHVV